MVPWLVLVHCGPPFLYNIAVSFKARLHSYLSPVLSPLYSFCLFVLWCCEGKFLCLSLSLFVVRTAAAAHAMQQQLPSCEHWTAMTLCGCGFHEWCSNLSIWSWVLGFCVKYALEQVCCTQGKSNLNSHDRYGSSSLGLLPGNIE
jgi:hypothetical protein